MSFFRSATVAVMVAALGGVLQMAGPGAGHAEEQGGSASDFELLRSDIRSKKAALIAERMNLSEKEAEAFWPVYRQYEVDLAAIVDKKVALLKDYMSHHETLTDQQAKQLADDVMNLDQRTLDLRTKCLKALEDKLPAKTAVRWLQIERRLQLYVDAQLAKELPAIKK